MENDHGVMLILAHFKISACEYFALNVAEITSAVEAKTWEAFLFA